MRKTVIFLLLLSTLLMAAAGAAWAQQDSPGYPIMKFTSDELLDNLARNSIFPKAKASSSPLRALPASYSVLNLLTYEPATHNQGSCGNCWIWAGTTLLDVALRDQKGIADRLSTQYATSCVPEMGLRTCCEGGTLWNFNQFYEAAGRLVPWGNQGADYQSGGLTCTACSSVDTTGSYPLGRIDIRTVDTTGEKQEVINTIKSLLNQNKAVWFAFYLGQPEDWLDFYGFWDGNSEDVPFDFSVYQDHFFGTGGGGHAVVIVGYDENDWLVLNSWGTVGGQRPSVLFRMPQNMDYGATVRIQDDDSGEIYNYPMFEFAALDVDFDAAAEPSTESVVLEGDMYYSLDLSANTAAMQAGRIRNLSSGGRSGTLYLTLWATSGNFDPDGTKYMLARYELGELEGGQSLENVSVTGQFTFPPNGEYRITLALSEWRTDNEEPGESIQDFYQFPGKVTLTHEKRSSGGGGGCFIDNAMH